MRHDFVFTSESVTEGHPDKLCDVISDAVVDHLLRLNPLANMVVECAVSTGVLFVAASLPADVSVDIPTLARQVIAQIGYQEASFNPRTCSVMTTFTGPLSEGWTQADERSLSEEEIERIPARNQITVFGYACRQTPGFMPLPIWLAHKLARRLTAVRLQGLLPGLRPDGGAQVGVEYRQGRPARIHSLTLLASHDAACAARQGRLRDDLMEAVIRPAFADEPIGLDRHTRIFVNPDGPFVEGGPGVHSGLTGRKTAMDTYGGFARHGGAALSGKGPARIDRIGAYAARYAAKNLIAAGLAEECEVQLSYTIGIARPVSVQVETFGTGRRDDGTLSALVARHFDFRPAGIVRQFGLRSLPAQSRQGFFRRLAAYGQMGRMDLGLPWEVTDRAARLLEG